LFFRTRDANPSLSIQPFAPLYQLMLELAQGRAMPESPDKRGIPAEVEGFAYLSGLQLQVISSLLAEGRYIPQEIINYQILAGILG